MARSASLYLLHGALGCAADMAPLLEALHSRLPATAFNFRGHGPDAASDAAFSIAAFAEDFLNAIAAETEPVDVFGYSMGGYVALYAAARHPERIRRVFTLGTKLAWTPETGQKEASRLNVDVLAEKAPHFVALLARRHGTAWPNVVRKTAGLLQALGQAPDLGASPDQLGQAGIQAQVCIARGELDRMVEEAECREAVAQLPFAAYLPLAGQPHPLEQVEARVLAEQLMAFLK
jgi:pimeloyl-ACP methyl ester carboxylesterase